jgi:hypothetical protein
MLGNSSGVWDFDVWSEGCEEEYVAGEGREDGMQFNPSYVLCVFIWPHVIESAMDDA